MRDWILVEKGQCRSDLVGPIAEGELHEQAAFRLEKTFNCKIARYAFEFFDEPLRGENQQFPSIIGTIWAEKK